MQIHRYTFLRFGWIFLLHPLLARCQELFVSGLHPYFAWGSYNSLETDAFCFATNAAALARCRQGGAGLTGERPYGIGSLGRYRCAVILPLRAGSAGLQGGFAGTPPYRETMLSFSYGRRLFESIDIGAQAAFTRGAVSPYDARNYLVASTAMILHLTSQLNAGWQASVTRQVGGRTAHSPGKPRYSMGMGYNPSPAWSAGLEIGRDAVSGIGAALGFIYRPHRVVMIRMGFTTGGPPIWFGIGYQLKRFRLDISASVHDRLGFSPALGILHTKMIGG